MLGAEEIGRVEQIELDEWVGWFRGRWAPSPRFAEVEELFAAERAFVLGRYDAHAWRSVWEQMWARGVRLVFDGTQFDRDFAVEIESEDKAWLTYWGARLDRAPPRASVGPATRKDLVAVDDPAWRQAVEGALARTGELVCLTMRDAIRRWFLVRTPDEL